MRLRDSGLSLIPILAVATVAYLLAACATGHRQERVTYTACDGRTVTAFVRVEESNAPALDCAKAWSDRGGHPASVALFLATLPFGCSIRYGDNSEGPTWLVIVPAGPLAGPVWEHEKLHTMNYVHLPGTLWPMWRDCR